MEKKRMPLQHKIIFGYIILVAVIGSMIAILIYERRQMREVEGGVARLWRMYEDIYTTHRHVTGLALQGEAAAGWSDAERDDFFKPKVMWKIIGCNINFSFNDGTMICNNAVNIMTGQRNQLLQFLGLMNCKLFDWYLKLTTEAEVQGGGIQLYVTTLEKTLVKLDFPMYLSEVINQRVNGIATDTDVDNIIFEAYKLTQEEIDYILSCKQVDR